VGYDRTRPEPEQDHARSARVRRQPAGLAEHDQTPGQAGTLAALQGSAGNQAVAALVGGTGHPTLRKGATGPGVVALQNALNRTSGYHLDPDGRYGNATEDAVKDFQRGHGLGPTGVAADLTWAVLDRLGGVPPAAAAGPDQHAGAALPGAATVEAVQAALNPATAADDGKVAAWDGAATRASDEPAAYNRLVLRTQLVNAMAASLAVYTPQINAKASARAVPVATFEGAGRQAKRVVDDVFGSIAGAGVLTEGQHGARQAFGFTAGVNLLDASDTSVRPVESLWAATWLADHEPAALAVRKAHGFNPARGDAERRFFEDEVVAPFAAAHKAELEKFGQYGFGYAEPGPRVLIVPRIMGKAGFSDDAPEGGLSRAERRRRWQLWQVLVHEYLHTLTHPAFDEAARGNGIMIEGCCEMFAREVVERLIPLARADADPALRAGIEGTGADGELLPGFTPDLVPDHDKAYEQDVRQALKVRAAAGADAVRAAYFQGHVELIGLTRGGDKAAPAPDGADDLVTVPPVVRSAAALAIMCGTYHAEVLAANPGLTAEGPLPPTVRVPGCRYHVVVAATEETATGAIRARRAEGRAEIAAQNGVTEDALDRANPGLHWHRLRAGDRVLIPRH
jgi:peptidoglycan hydrolase-like protein with peptidoglycan-binding domain